MSKNPSPLRYPGGKFKIAPLIKYVIDKSNIENCVYIEPFVGGGGVALSLLLSGSVEEIVINDYDRAIASFWKAILNDTDRFLRLIETVPLTIHEWQKQRNIYFSSTSYSLEYGFATFYLNRTNFSGILSSGPIGGQAQNNPTRTLAVRFCREELIDKISNIARFKKKIHCYNKDIISFLCGHLPQYMERGFIYFDPPYYNKGQRLYKNFLKPEDHQNIAQHIFDVVNCPWIVSYDNTPEIENIYKNYPSRKFSLSYSLANNGQGTEIMFFKNISLCPSAEELLQAKIKLIWK